ncbi:MAG: SET domain-containing protein-lysine N-methyltransferase, partial [Planctomycetia bacterium]|nr:SET domain-containing protein-lysine N-methyltransferase [Planctomycetia bacterium]
MQVDADTHVLPDGVVVLVNHSCEPNCGVLVRANERQIEVRALRPIVAGEEISFEDGRLGRQTAVAGRGFGDFLVWRRDDTPSYQLACAVDDAEFGITEVVRGEDLADNTARQILLQRALGLPTPRYLHTPLVLAADGQKLSKQNGAQAMNTRHPLACLQAAGQVLGLPAAHLTAQDLPGWLSQAVEAGTVNLSTTQG